MSQSKAFSSVFGRVWPKAATPENAKSGFKSCYIFPLDKTAIDWTKLLPSQVFTNSDRPHAPVTSKKGSTSKTAPTLTVSLNTFEAALGPEKVSLFKRRLEAGYDLSESEDSIYSTSKKLKNESLSSKFIAPKPCDVPSISGDSADVPSTSRRRKCWCTLSLRG